MPEFHTFNNCFLLKPTAFSVEQVARFYMRIFQIHIHTQIMTQMKIEIKYFSLGVENFFRNTDVVIDKSLALTEVQQLQKNITGGLE